ncbi:lytic transglycosylase domain-containing protein [Kineosporia rhizophila]|uniref:lytic transglycosylase domain-containing protein n=1 Tax=Kineosporia rhizophila TaxID=84633 RepID=UPI001E639810|nr:lytic transglycosylase domain-containing protein [Kineosporia rhizophila]
MSSWATRLAVLAAGTVLTLAVGLPILASAQPADSAGGQLNTSKIPLHLVEHIQAAAGTCPQLTAPLIAAQLWVESGFQANAVSPANAQGIAQFTPPTWTDWGTDANSDGVADPFDPADAIAAQASYMCSLIEQFRRAGYAGDVVDLALAGYNAGPGAVQQYGGMPPYPDVVKYVAKVRDNQTTFTTALPAASGRAPDGTWPDETCTIAPDPTTGTGCITPRTANLVTHLRNSGWNQVTCWDEHAWNPTSDHPLGRACDITIGRLGRRPNISEQAQGDQLAAQLQAAAPALGINYLIWAGQIWSTERSNEGWRPYGGGGVYDPGDITGGHYDHIHASMY